MDGLSMVVLFGVRVHNVPHAISETGRSVAMNGRVTGDTRQVIKAAHCH